MNGQTQVHEPSSLNEITSKLIKLHLGIELNLRIFQLWILRTTHPIRYSELSMLIRKQLVWLQMYKAHVLIQKL